MDSLGITYEREYRYVKLYNICKKHLRFDYRLQNYNGKEIVIEYQGRQHYNYSSFFHTVDHFENLKTNDKIKKEFCELNNIKMIEIKYTKIDKIETILLNELKAVK